MQTEIDWTQIVHKKENNPGSEQILNSQKVRLSNNCKKLYDALKSGERLTGAIITQKYNMLEYRRRIKDLKKVLDIQEIIISGGCKEWFL